MTRDILGHPVKLGRRYADGSRPLHSRASCQGSPKKRGRDTPVDNAILTGTVNVAHCPWHNPSKHKMRDWPRLIRFDKRGLVERICEHGCGHPDPDSLDFMVKHFGDQTWGIHGCDGCPEGAGR